MRSSEISGRLKMKSHNKIVIFLLQLTKIINIEQNMIQFELQYYSLY